MKQNKPERIPPEYLPGSGGEADHNDEALFESRISRLVEAAEPTLERYREGQTGWWQPLADYWQPATVAAFAGTAALFFAYSFTHVSQQVPTMANLAIVAAASDGNPASLWSAVGQEADPVLAVIALAREEP